MTLAQENALNDAKNDLNELKKLLNEAVDSGQYLKIIYIAKEIRKSIKNARLYCNKCSKLKRTCPDCVERIEEEIMQDAGTS